MNFYYAPPPTAFPPAPGPWGQPPAPPPPPPPYAVPPQQPFYDAYAPSGAPTAPSAAPASPPMQAQRGGPELIYAVIVTVAQKIWGAIKGVFGG